MDNTKQKDQGKKDNKDNKMKYTTIKNNEDEKYKNIKWLTGC